MNIPSSQEGGGEKECGDEGEVFIVMVASCIPSPGSRGGYGIPPRMWCGPAQLRS